MCWWIANEMCENLGLLKQIVQSFFKFCAHFLLCWWRRFELNPFTKIRVNFSHVKTAYESTQGVSYFQKKKRKIEHSPNFHSRQPFYSCRRFPLIQPFFSNGETIFTIAKKKLRGFLLCHFFTITLCLSFSTAWCLLLTCCSAAPLYNEILRWNSFAVYANVQCTVYACEMARCQTQTQPHRHKLSRTMTTHSDTNRISNDIVPDFRFLFYCLRNEWDILFWFGS